jgi:hypothetical protein
MLRKAKPAGSSGMRFLANQLTAVADDGYIVMGFGPVDAAEECHV